MKYGLEYRGNALARTSSNSKLQTRPLVREDATKYQTHNCLKKISRRKKNWSQIQEEGLTPRRTGGLTVGRNATLTSCRSTVTNVAKSTECVSEQIAPNYGRRGIFSFLVDRSSLSV
jgi:hypothetical protein